MRQRRELIGKPVREIVEAIINPTDEISAMRLRLLLAHRRFAGPIPYFSQAKLRLVLSELNERYPAGPIWHEDLKLRELSDLERRQLVRALIARAPEDWRRAAA